MGEKKTKVDVAYLCDQHACGIDADCLECHHTTNVEHAKNFKKLGNGKYMEKEDLVNHPSHYTQGDVETIDKMVIIFGAEATAIHCTITCFKYLDRYKFKGYPQLDLGKALWYAKKAYSLYYPDEPYEEVSFPTRDFEFKHYSSEFDYQAFYIEEAKRDLTLLYSSDYRKCLANLIRHIDAAIDSQ